MNGFLLIDKPEGITSFAVVARVRKLLNVGKAGHCGTLDPLATGLLIVCLGKATKLAQFVSSAPKRYLAEIRLGATSTTYDRDGEIKPTGFDGDIGKDAIALALQEFTGRITQTAPAFSALKHRGRPLYEYARRNIEVEPRQREVVIETVERLEFDYPRLIISVDCSSGTYIRSLAHDLGARLGCGGYIQSLRRTSIGRHDIGQAVTLEQLEQQCQGRIVVEQIRQGLEDDGQSLAGFISIDTMLDLPAVYLTSSSADDVTNGVAIKGHDIVECNRPFQTKDVVAVRGQGGKLLAVGRALYATAQLEILRDQRVLEYIRVI